MMDGNMYYSYIGLIPFLPFIGFLFNSLYGYRLRVMQTGLIASILSSLSFIISFYLFLDFLSLGRIVGEVKYFEWIAIGKLNATFGFRIDELSITMALVVSFVGSIIHFYSIGYMHNEEGHFRYFSYINLFMFFMLTLVLANNILLMFLGWEGVGLASYLLIGFYYRDKKEDIERFKIAPSSAGMKAFIVNRIGTPTFRTNISIIGRSFFQLSTLFG
jgi:NADH-quinone oxidoreductase subunit L